MAKLLKEPNIYKSIGVKGESKKTFLDNQVVFKCLKFTTTSYNNNVKLFRVYLALEILFNSCLILQFSKWLIDSSIRSYFSRNICGFKKVR